MKYNIRQRSTHMVTDATDYHTIDSSEFVNCTPKYEGTSQREFVEYLDDGLISYVKENPKTAKIFIM